MIMVLSYLDTGTAPGQQPEGAIAPSTGRWLDACPTHGGESALASTKPQSLDNKYCYQTRLRQEARLWR